MKYNLYSKNIEINDFLQNYLEEKLSKIERFCQKIISLNVDLSRDLAKKTGPVFRAEMNLKIPGKLLRVVEYDFEIMAAIDKAKDKLARQAKKIKEKNALLKTTIRKNNKFNVNLE